MAVSLLALVMAGCSSSPPRSTLSPPPQGQAILTGGIAPCEGRPIPNGPRYAAGVVDVLKGQLTWRTTAPGIEQVVFPESVVAEQRVTTNGSYRFVLSPGSYVLRARYATGANATPWTQVVLVSGTTIRADIPDMCM